MAMREKRRLQLLRHVQLRFHLRIFFPQLAGLALEQFLGLAQLEILLHRGFISGEQQVQAPDACGGEMVLPACEENLRRFTAAGLADAMAEALSIDLPEDRDYATAAGHVLHILRHLPAEGEAFTDQGWRFEVVDMDGRKIDKLRVRLAEKAIREDAVEGL